MQVAWIPEAVSIGLLLAVLVVAVLRPKGLPEASAAVPAAAACLALGLVSPASAGERVLGLVPTLIFLAAVLVLAHLADREGVFEWLGSRVGRASRGDPRRLLVLTFVAAAATTAVLSLDATVVLLTPVLLLTARERRMPAKPHLHACAHLANTASTLLPVSNLTNLLAFRSTGLSFLGFTALMAGPWLVSLLVEWLVFRRFFRGDLARPDDAECIVDGRAEPGAPRFALGVLGLVLVGFAVSSLIDLEPYWVAVAGAVVLAWRGVRRRTTRVATALGQTAPLFLLFVACLAVVVQAVADQGLGAALAAILPSTTGFPALLAAAAFAAVLANLVNNLPATLVLLPALGAHPEPGLVLAVLLGVNLGPNLTYVGSLATLLWRRVLAAGGDPPKLGEFTRLGLRATPAALLASVGALWCGLRLGGLA